MERRPDGSLLFRLGQPLHQILTVIIVAIFIAAMFIYGALSNQKPFEVGGEVWASAGVVNVVLGMVGLIAFAMSFPLMLALRARLNGRQGVRLESRRVVLDGVHRKGTIQFQYADIAKAGLSSKGRHEFVLIQKKDGEKMTIPLLLFQDKADPARLVAQVKGKLATGAA